MLLFLAACAVELNVSPLSAANQCLDEGAIRSAFKKDRDEFGWKYDAPLLYYVMNLNSQNYLRVFNSDGIRITKTQNSDGKCHHKVTFAGTLIGSCKLTKSDLDKELAKRYKMSLHKTAQGKEIQLQDITPDKVVLSEAQQSDDPGLCSYNLSVVDLPFTEL